MTQKYSWSPESSHVMMPKSQRQEQHQPRCQKDTQVLSDCKGADWDFKIQNCPTTHLGMWPNNIQHQILQECHMHERWETTPFHWSVLKWQQLLNQYEKTKPQKNILKEVHILGRCHQKPKRVVRLTQVLMRTCYWQPFRQAAGNKLRLAAKTVVWVLFDFLSK